MYLVCTDYVAQCLVFFCSVMSFFVEVDAFAFACP